MAKKPQSLAPVASEFLFYAAPDGAVKVRVLFRDETAWLTQKALAELFGVKVPAIAKHLKNIFDSGELGEETVVSILETTAADGKNYQTRFYNLDAIIAVGYRVNSYQATQFRIWATKTLREFMIKGFVLDDERLKQGKSAFGKDYFDELLERIREIRASERRFYQKITDIYALSIDYDPNAPLTKEFFATVQNKLHWAITGQTAAELIHDSADATKLFMGLTTWKHAPDGQDPQVRRDGGEELPERGARQGAEPHRLRLPRPGREPRQAGHADEDGGLGELPAPVPRAVQLPDPRRQGQGHLPRSEAQGRGRVRGLSQEAGCRVSLRFRPRRRTGPAAPRHGQAQGTEFGEEGKEAMSPCRAQPRSRGAKRTTGIECIGGRIAMPAYVRRAG